MSIIKVEYVDPRQIKKNSRGVLRAKCNRCGKWVTLVHKTKAHPYGSRLHDHKMSGYNCYGIPTFIAEGFKK